MADAAGSSSQNCPDGSVVAERYATGKWRHRAGQRVPESYPSNTAVLRAVYNRVSASVDTYRNYRYVACYMLFMALYMGVLYFHASSFHCGEVVRSLKSALLPGGSSPELRFSSESAVLDWLESHVVAPVWTDPICGDGRCEAPWEMPAWGPFGCEADCGLNPDTRKAIVVVSADFTGHPSLSPAMLRDQVSWNLCMNDTRRAARGLSPLCWFPSDQTFSDAVETQIRAVTLLPGQWYVMLMGDLAGKVGGAVYDASAGDDLAPMQLTPAWETCTFRRRRQPTSAAAGRRLLAELAAARAAAGPAGDALLSEAVQRAARAVAAAGISTGE